jgi:hypothetical protein
MTNTFLSLVAQNILKVTSGDFKNIAIVFPNRRSGSMFKQELINQIVKPSWSPKIFSIDDWLVSLSGLEKIDRLAELAMLFKNVRQELPFIRNFGEFMDLGETMLADFDDVDKYLADPHTLFTTLNEIKKIDSQFDITSDEELINRIRVFWSGFGTGRSSHQEKWLEIWDKLLPIYQGFREGMLENRFGTSGICYRKAVEDMESGRTAIGNFSQVVFVGFNILTAAEEAIFSYLRNAGKAIFYWDYHSYYLEDPHESGKFIQSYLNQFPPPFDFQPFPDGAWDFFGASNPVPVIQVVPLTSNTGQVQALLNDIKIRPAINRGIVLSDEGLFSDLLSLWPDDLPVNFTSGYPLRDTQSAGFIKSLMSVYLAFNQSQDNCCQVSIILDFLRHPWAKWLTGDTSDLLISLIQKRYPDSVPYEFVISEPNLSSWIASLNSGMDFLNRLSAVFVHLKAFEYRYTSIEKSACELIASQVIVFKEVIGNYSLDIDVKSISKLVNQFIQVTKISLETDRDANNQVTGVLETRLIDFDEVFILSFNEGIWPSKSLPGSFIPYSMRRIFSLPTAENRDAMYAYYFYRLVQRTKALYIYYLTGHRDDVIRSGEKSRYLTQLQFELPGRIEYRMEPPAQVGNAAAPIILRKEGIVKERLNRYLDENQGGKYLSASALNEFMDCGLRFALKRIYEFKEPDEIAFVSEPKGFGILIHQVMNRLYKEFIGLDKGPEKKWLQKLINDREELIQVVREEYNNVLKETGNVKSGGKDLLAMEVVRQYLVKILEFDHLNTPQKILGLEQKFSRQYQISLDKQSVTVNLGGFIDRIDQLEQGIRIIDYKTGNCDLNAKSVAEMFDCSLKKRPKEVFQVMMYCEFFLQESLTQVPIIPVLFRLGRFRAGENDHRILLSGKEITFSEIRIEFNQGLKSTLENLFNPDIPFVQSENDQVCRYCPFTGICSRQNHS